MIEVATWQLSRRWWEIITDRVILSSLSCRKLALASLWATCYKTCSGYARHAFLPSSRKHWIKKKKQKQGMKSLPGQTEREAPGAVPGERLPGQPLWWEPRRALPHCTTSQPSPSPRRSGCQRPRPRLMPGQGEGPRAEASTAAPGASVGPGPLRPSPWQRLRRRAGGKRRRARSLRGGDGGKERGLARPQPRCGDLSQLGKSCLRHSPAFQGVAFHTDGDGDAQWASGGGWLWAEAIPLRENSIPCYISQSLRHENVVFLLKYIQIYTVT